VGEEIPIRKLHILQQNLSRAIKENEWDKAAELARKMIKLIPLAVGMDTCRTGKPHLDGIFNVGQDQYLYATKEAKKYINMLNRILKTAKQSIKKIKKRKK